MADKKISELTEMGTGVLASGDWFVVVDTTTGETKKINAIYIDEQITTAFTRTLLDDATAAAARATLGVLDMALLPQEAMKNLNHLLYPSFDGGYGELYANGWQPTGFNQQWGGPWGGDMPDGRGTQKWFPAGYVEGNINLANGQAAGTTWDAQAFRVSESITADAVWLKLTKVGAPQKDNEPLVVYIASSLDDGAGVTAITNGTMDTMDGPGFTGESMASASEPWPIRGTTTNDTGAWYRFTDASGSFSLTANTTYYVVMKATGADGANHFEWITQNTSSNRYPHGNHWDGNSAVPAAWTEDTSAASCFLIEAAAGSSLLQDAGQFGDGHGFLEFGEGSGNYTHESRCIQRPLKDFWTKESFTMRILTEGALTASKTLLDINYGLLHKDRIRLYVDGSNFLVLKVYESDATVHTVQGTTDVTTAAVRDIMFSVRSKADGSDFVKLFLAGTAEGTALASQTITISNLLKEIGTCFLGGGFPAPPTWTKDFRTDQFANGNLPSNDADTAVVTANNATQAQSFMILSGTAADKVMWMNYEDTQSVNDTAYYDCDPTYVAATGGISAWLIHPQKVVNAAGESGLLLSGNDGTNRAQLKVHEHYLEIGSTADAYIQHDFLKSPTLIELKMKGSDYYVYINGKFVFDGTGIHDDASADNHAILGDADTTALSGADCTIMEWLVYVGGPLLMEVNGCQLSEFACWSGDQTGLANELYNSGTELSVKQVCGIDNHVLKFVPFSTDLTGITASPTTTSTTFVLVTDMESFGLLSGADVLLSFSASMARTGGAGQCALSVQMDQVRGGAINTLNNLERVCRSSAAGATQSAEITRIHRSPLVGLHKFEGLYLTDAGTTRAQSWARNLVVREI